MIRLVDVNGENWRTPLEVAPEQKEYVADRTTPLARAYAFRGQRSRACFLCDGDTPGGRGRYYDCPELDGYDFSQIFVDRRYQRKGYGKAAVARVLETLRADGKYRKVVLCYIEGNQAAKRLYEGFGFVVTDRDGDEIVMELML